MSIWGMSDSGCERYLGETSNCLRRRSSRALFCCLSDSQSEICNKREIPQCVEQGSVVSKRGNASTMMPARRIERAPRN